MEHDNHDFLHGARNIALYFLPSIVAVARKHHNGAGISILNLFLGWTLTGWVVALVWSVSAKDQQSAGVNTKYDIYARKPETPKIDAEQNEEKVCPDCAETIKAAAKVCRFCGYLFDSNEAD